MHILKAGQREKRRRFGEVDLKERDLREANGCTLGNNKLWEQFTGREHLLFYGGLKNLRGSALFHSGPMRILVVRV